MNIKVERSKEFVERLKDNGVRGNECVEAFYNAHKARRLLLLGKYIVTFHVLDQCQERGIDTDIQVTLEENDFIIKSKVGPHVIPHLSIESKEANLILVGLVEGENVVFLTAYKYDPIPILGPDVETNLLLRESRKALVSLWK